MSIIEQAVEVLKTEAEGILNLVPRLDHHFDEMVDAVCNTTGRLIVSGIGKSGIVGRKIVATLNSTGTRSLFLHPVEAMHGDLGMVSPDDILLALSNSGETDELNILVPSIRRIGCRVIAFTGNLHSTLARHSDIVIDVGVEREACPLGLAPTASTTALLAMGDALAVVLINKKQFNSSDFKRFHPGGNLGQRLSRQVQDLMLRETQIPIVYVGDSINAAIQEINRLEIGATLVLNKDRTLAGIVTDGDIRRWIALQKPLSNGVVDDIMTPHPREVLMNSPVCDALNLMEKYQITALAVVDVHHKVQGFLHLHDILGKGDVKYNGHT